MTDEASATSTVFGKTKAAFIAHGVAIEQLADAAADHRAELDVPGGEVVVGSLGIRRTVAAIACLKLSEAFEVRFVS